jgi:hypothetical protein
MTEQQKEIIKKALLTIERHELKMWKAVNCIDITPSPEYVKAMDKLLKKEQKMHRQFFKNKKRKLLTILIAALLIFSSIFSVSAIREPIIEYVKKVYETFTHFFLDEEIPNTKSSIKTEYSVTWLPDEYIKNLDINQEAYIQHGWNKNEAYLIFTQHINGVDSIHLNTEQNAFSILEIGNQLYYYNNFDGNYFIIWTTDDYAFSLKCSESVGWDNILKILENIKPVK